jgi:zinc transport system ATP-binding protein
MNIPAIEMKDVYFSYKKTPILENITFALKQGDFLGIIGPNGSGKTTLLKLMLGLIKPDRGIIKILGKPPHHVKHRIGYVPQNTDFNVTFPISVLDVALMGRLSRSRIGKWYSGEDFPSTEDALRKVGMWKHRRVSIGSLSGGQRQRVFIARALATDPDLLFLDEPTASVDLEFGTNLFDLLHQLNETVTIVTITHDVGVISRHVKSVACVNKSLTFHSDKQISAEMIDDAYQCPVDLIAHGLPHRVLPIHEDK